MTNPPGFEVMALLNEAARNVFDEHAIRLASDAVSKFRQDYSNLPPVDLGNESRFDANEAVKLFCDKALAELRAARNLSMRHARETRINAASDHFDRAMTELSKRPEQ